MGRNNLLCANITVIDFKGMALNGTISPSFARLRTLKVINLSHNNLNGNIPEELSELRNLETIDVSYCCDGCERIQINRLINDKERQRDLTWFTPNGYVNGQK